MTQEAYYACNLLLGLEKYPEHDYVWTYLYSNGQIQPPIGVSLKGLPAAPRFQKLYWAWTKEGNTVWKPIQF